MLSLIINATKFATANNEAQLGYGIFGQKIIGMRNVWGRGELTRYGIFLKIGTHCVRAVLQ